MRFGGGGGVPFINVLLVHNHNMFVLSFLETNHHYLMSSFNEVAAFTLLKGNPVEFVKYPLM